MSDSIHKLPTCGRKKTEILNGVGIATINDLIRYEGIPPSGVNLFQLKEIAKKQTKQHEVKEKPKPLNAESPFTEKHSWFGMGGHMLTTRTVKRVQIDKLVISPCGVIVIVQWFENGEWITRSATPVMLYSTFLLWNNNSIVSDDECEDDKNIVSRMIRHQMDLTVKFCVTEDKWSLSDIQKNALNQCVREVRRLQEYSLYEHIINNKM